MSKNTNLKELFSSLQAKMAGEMSVNLNHPGDKGDNTEKCWIEWFDRYFPERYTAEKATIIDCDGRISDQIDIVIYDRQYSCLAFNQNNILYLPAESVYAVFEVRQDLSKKNIEYAGKKAESVRKLRRTSAPVTYVNGQYKPKKLHHIIAGILTTKSGWEIPFGEPFKKSVSSMSDNQQLDCGCVLNGGAFFYNHEKNTLKTSCENEALVSFYLQFSKLLQSIGTVPAIDFEEYLRMLNIREELLQDVKTKGF